MELFITITDIDETGEWFTAALWENIPYVIDPPAHEADGSTPQEALANLIAALDVTEAVAAELGIDPAVVGKPCREYVCSGCGSNQIETYAWAPMNGAINSNNVEFHDGHPVWCGGCETTNASIEIVNHYPSEV